MLKWNGITVIFVISSITIIIVIKSLRVTLYHPAYSNLMNNSPGTISSIIIHTLKT